MKSTHRATVLSTLMLCASAGAQDMLGISYFSTVYKIDSSTGIGTSIGSSFAAEMNSLARRSDGKLFAGGGFTTSKIYEIDPVSGLSTLVLSGLTGSIRGMAFDGGDQLHAIIDPTLNGSLPDELFRVDLITGGLSKIGPVGFNGVQALAWMGGQFYGWDAGPNGVGAGLITIDPLTAVGADVNPAIGGNNLEVQALAFAPSGLLFGAATYLSTIDVTTGFLAPVGPAGTFDVRGIEFVSTPPTGPTVYCTAKTASCGAVPTIGGPSATASLSGGSGSYDVSCGPVPGSANPSILFYSTAGALPNAISTPQGFLCVTPGGKLFRVPGISLPVGGGCSAKYTYDFGHYLATQTVDPNLVAGAQVDMQAWYRDPPSPGGSNYSNAMSFGLVP